MLRKEVIMSLHSSLRISEKLASMRSVMKRAERIKWLIEKGLWKEGDRVTGLPKIKVIKLKAIKKEKAKEEEVVAVEGAVPVEGEVSAQEPAKEQGKEKGKEKGKDKGKEKNK